MATAVLVLDDAVQFQDAAVRTGRGPGRHAADGSAHSMSALFGMLLEQQVGMLRAWLAMLARCWPGTFCTC